MRRRSCDDLRSEPFRRMAIATVDGSLFGFVTLLTLMWNF
jgi:hypothetical protein